MKLNEFKAIVSHYKELECKFGVDGLQKVFSLLELNEQTVKSALPLRLKIKEFNTKIENYGLQKISELAETYSKEGKDSVAECLRSVTSENSDLDLSCYKNVIIDLRNLEYDIYKDRLFEEVDLAKEEFVPDMLARKQEAEKIYEEVIAELKKQPLFLPGNPECMFEISSIQHLNRLTGNHDILDYYVNNIKVINEDIDVRFCWGDKLLNQMRELEPNTFLTKLSATIIGKQKDLTQLSQNIAKNIEEARFLD